MMQAEIKNAVETLSQGGIILFPSDTSWSIACDASNTLAVKKILELKSNAEFTCLITDARMLQKYINKVPEAALSIIDITDKPTTIIYEEGKNIVSEVIKNNEGVAIRIPDDDFCFFLSRKLNGAVAITSANLENNSSSKSYKEISPEVLKGVDYVVNLHHEKIFTKPPSIIKLKNNGEVKIIRA